MTYMALYAVLILPVLSFVLVAISKRHVSISEKLSTDSITKGQACRYQVRIRNHYFLPCASARIRLEADSIGLRVDSKEKYFSIPPYRIIKLASGISGNYRGAYEIGVKDITLYDFLGLFQFKLKHNKKLVLTITPRIIPIPDLSLEPVPQEGSISRNHLQGEDYGTISELRKYQPTDSYRQIHWKASAKRNDLISKKFQSSERQMATFFVDNSHIEGYFHKALEKEDRIIEAVVSAMSHCHYLEYPISLHCLGRERVDFTTDFTCLYQETAQIPFGRFGDFSDLLSDYLRSERDLMNLLIFAQNVNEKLLSTLRTLRLSGNHINLFLFDRISSEAIRELEVLEIRYIYSIGKFSL